MRHRYVSVSFLFTLLTAGLGPGSAFAMQNPIENLVVFGDSQSDLGNSHRWSDGPAWSENLAVAWNASLYSFAYSGSVCDTALFRNGSDETPSIRDQIDLFYSLEMSLAPGETVFALWVGMSDIQKIYGQQPQPLDTKPTIEDVAFCIGQQIRQLRKVFSVNRIMVFTVPPLQHMPYFTTAINREEISRAALALNQLIRQDVGTINKHHHAFELDLVDVYSLLNDVVEMPGAFGFSNAADSYLDTCRDGCIDDADQYVWWDRIHLTGGVHRMIANAVLLAGSYSPPGGQLEPSAAQIKALLETPGSRFRSPVYVPPPNTGQFAKYVEALENAPPKTIHVEQDEDLDLNDSWRRMMTMTNGMMVFAVMGLVWWVKYYRQRGRLDMSGGLLGSPLHHPSALAAQHRGRVFSPFRPSSSAATQMSEQKHRLSG